MVIPLLAGVAELENGDRKAAIQRLARAGLGRPIDVLQDARQNMWRFAGRLDKAGLAAGEWTGRRPAAALPSTGPARSLSSPEGLRRAARLFASSARWPSRGSGTWST